MLSWRHKNWRYKKRGISKEKVIGIKVLTERKQRKNNKSKASHLLEWVCEIVRFYRVKRV